MPSQASPFTDWLVWRKVTAKLGGRIRLVASGSAPLAPVTRDFLRVAMCAPVIEGYGLTETIGSSFACEPIPVGPPHLSTCFSFLHDLVRPQLCMSKLGRDQDSACMKAAHLHVMLLREGCYVSVFMPSFEPCAKICHALCKSPAGLHSWTAASPCCAMPGPSTIQLHATSIHLSSVSCSAVGNTCRVRKAQWAGLYRCWNSAWKAFLRWGTTPWPPRQGERC